MGAGDTPALRVTGRVTPAGRISVDPEAATGRRPTVIDHIGTGPVAGTFAGLPEGARLAVGGTE